MRESGERGRRSRADRAGGFGLAGILLTLAGAPALGAQEPPARPDQAPAPQAALVRVDTVRIDTVTTSLFDNGKMWTFEHPPVDYLRERYGFQPDSSWFRKARLGALRIPGCSASFVSPGGLVMTNHHCARDAAAEVSQEGEDLAEGGFYAGAIVEERALVELHADQLVEILDVTDRIHAALEGVTDPSERAELRDTVTQEVGDSIAEARGGEEAGAVVEVIGLYQGALYSAYVFRRYSDVRLVFVPELDVGKFGGDPDNFTYPRYSLDMSFLRVYDDAGEPLATEHWFPWSPEGVEDGDLIFVVGNPGSTSRLQTVAQLELRRDVIDAATEGFFDARVSAYQRFLAEHPDADPAGVLRNHLLAAQNNQKLYRGMVRGLHDPYIMARRQALQDQLMDSVRGRPDLAEAYGHVVDSIDAIQGRMRELEAGYRGLLALTDDRFTTAVLHRALWAFQWIILSRQGAPQEQLQDLKESALEVAEQPPALQELLLADRFRMLRDAYGQDHPAVQGLLAGRSPEGAAARIVQGSVLADSARAARALESDALPVTDPGIQLMNGLIRPIVEFQQGFFGLQDRLDDLTSRLGRARHEIYGTRVPPDATFSLRIADGVVRGYEYNGTVAPPYTTFFGLYDHFHSYRGTDGAEEWSLPADWLSPPESFDLSTPLNFVSTADIIGGNSGSPVLDRELRIVGLVFDGNIESLPGDYIYLPAKNRAVAVDARGMLEALDEMYGADRLVLELTTGELVETEAQAEAGRSGGE